MRDDQNIKEIFDSSCPLPTQTETESTCERVLLRLKAGTIEFSDQMTEEPNWTRPMHAWRLRPIWGVAALVALVLLSIALVRTFVTPNPFHAIVENEDGTQYRLAAGDVVATDAWTRLTLTLPDGSRAEMRFQSELALEPARDGMRIRLARGSIIVNAASRRYGHLYVETKDMSVSVIGTVFVVTVEEAGSRLSVLEGQVRVDRSGASRDLSSGQQFVTNPQVELASLREEVAWSRYVEEHLRLLPHAEPPSEPSVEKSVEMAHALPPALPQQTVPSPPAPRPQFEVASVKRNNSGSRERGRSVSPGRLSASNMSIRLLLQDAYKVEDFQIVGAPAWIDSEHYDIEAKAEETTHPQVIIGPMLQALLEDRFKLAAHGETRDLPVYFLTVATNGSKLNAGTCLTREPGTPIAPGTQQSAYCGYWGVGDGTLRTTGASIELLANALSGILKRKVLDRSGLRGEYDVNLRWTPDLSTPENNTAPTTAEPGPSIFTAIEERLGLKLESGRAPIDVLVIERIERPSEN